GKTGPMEYYVVARVLWKPTPECDCVKKCMKEFKISIRYEYRKPGTTNWERGNTGLGRESTFISNPGQISGMDQYYLPTHQSQDLKVLIEVDNDPCKEHEISVR